MPANSLLAKPRQGQYIPCFPLAHCPGRCPVCREDAVHYDTDRTSLTLVQEGLAVRCGHPDCSWTGRGSARYINHRSRCAWYKTLVENAGCVRADVEKLVAPGSWSDEDLATRFGALQKQAERLQAAQAKAAQTEAQAERAAKELLNLRLSNATLQSKVSEGTAVMTNQDNTIRRLEGQHQTDKDNKKALEARNLTLNHTIRRMEGQHQTDKDRYQALEARNQRLEDQHQTDQTNIDECRDLVKWHQGYKRQLELQLQTENKKMNALTRAVGEIPRLVRDQAAKEARANEQVILLAEQRAQDQLEQEQEHLEQEQLDRQRRIDHQALLRTTHDMMRLKAAVDKSSKLVLDAAARGTASQGSQNAEPSPAKKMRI